VANCLTVTGQISVKKFWKYCYRNVYRYRYCRWAIKNYCKL